REPAVMRAASLPCCRLLETAAAHRRKTESVIDDTLHHVGHHVSNTRIENLASLRAEAHHGIAPGIAYRLDHRRRHANAVIRKDRVGGSHVERSRVIRAQSHGGSRLD